MIKDQARQIRNLHMILRDVHQAGELWSGFLTPVSAWA
jgi:hypothetical protein